MKLFAYGIFLGESTQQAFGIVPPIRYDVVKNYSTKLIGGSIVEAFPCKGHDLTGLLMEVPDGEWPRIDRLEWGYDRVTVTTVNGYEAQMYIAKDKKNNFPRRKLYAEAKS